MSDYLEEKVEEGIAIIGMDGRFPGAKNIAEFWHNIRNGVESISFFEDEELLAAGVIAETLADPNYVKAGAILDNVDLFDAAFFGISPREAKSMDPQHRLLLECAWSALESAGQDSENYDGRIGVYVGSSLSTYLHQNLQKNPEFLKSTGDLQIEIGNDKDFIPTRISYKLNLTGPSVSINTACSTSLVSVHLACQGLLDRECDMALAGGASISVPQLAGYMYEEDSITSPNGHCRPFDAEAKGTIFGSGVGIVLLKRLEDAIADRDPILAVIKGSAINNDGSLKVGYIAPSVDGQAEAIAEAQEIAEIDPGTITYIENHGTGTAMGDPIEIAALTKVFRNSTDKTGFCAIGSVKGNIGHLNRASGVIGLIKAVLALKNQEIPPSINYEQPNPQINFASSPFYVNTELQPWQTNDIPRRAGVSSFGVGGTNAHVVLEEAPTRKSSSSSRPWQLLLLSAKTEPALAAATKNLAKHLTSNPNLNLGDVAYTLQAGRRDWQQRRILVCQDVIHAAKTLQENNFTEPPVCEKSKVAFMFSGQGSQYVSMGKELYESEAIFREQVDYCCELLKPQLGLNLRDLIYPEADQIESATQQLTETRLTQPALFTIEYAIARLWMAWGIQPESLIGHSIGEYVAACIAGVFSLENALMLVAERGKLMQELPSGSMLSIFLPETEVITLLNDTLDLAVINAPDSCVVSGADKAIEAFEQQLGEKDIDCRRLHTSHAFHSSMMEPILATFTELVSKVILNSPQIPYISNVSGTWITAEEATDSSYWAKHLRSTVSFAAGVKELLQQSGILLEVGPGRMLKSLALKQTDNQIVLSSLRHPKEQTSDLRFMLNTLGQLWQAGVGVDWSRFYQQEQRDRLALPTYPFQRERYWVEPQTNLLPQLASANAIALVNKLEKTGKFSPVELQLLPKLLENLGTIELEASATETTNIDDWFYEIQWRTKSLASDKSLDQLKNWLILADNQGFGQNLANILTANGVAVTLVFRGEAYQQIGGQEFQIEPNSPENYARLWSDLGIDKSKTFGIVHLWSLDAVEATSMTIEDLKAATSFGCRSTLNLIQCLVNAELSDSCSLWLVTRGAQAINAENQLPGLSHSPLWGMGKVIGLEYPELNCTTVDLAPELSPNDAQSLFQEFSADDSEDRIAWRDRQRYVPRLVRKEVQTIKSQNLFSENSTYLITGGLKGLGLTVATWMAEQGAKHLVLVGRSQPIATTKQKISELEATGVQITVAQVDVTQTAQMAEVIQQIDTSLPPLKGVIHAAGILDDGVLQQLDWTKFARVMAPKTEGAWNLHTLTKDKSLDFFVLFSSVASLLGFPGQANHVAANTFLDTLAHYRQSQDLPGLSINWGLWGDVGTAVNKQVTGIEPIAPKLALQALAQLLSQSSPQIGFVPIDWSKYGQQFPSTRSTSYLAELVSQEQTTPAQQVSAQDIKQAEAGDRNSLLITYLQTQVAKALDTSVKQLDIQYPLAQIGLDSLMAIQLRNLFKTELGINLRMSQFMEDTTVVSLAKLFDAQLIASNSPTVDPDSFVDDPNDWLEGEI